MKERMGRAVSLIIGAHERLVAVNNVPDEPPKQFVGVFQTSSIKAFNSIFEHLQISAELSETMNGKSSWPSVAAILKLPEKTYLELNTTNEWQRVRKQAR